MAVKRRQGGSQESAGFQFVSADVNVESVDTDAGADVLQTLLADISADSQNMNAKLRYAVSLMADMGEWTAVVRLLIGVGGYQQAEIAEALGVMRSTVARWFNGETTPPRDQVNAYAARLLDYMKPTRPLDLRVAPYATIGNATWAERPEGRISDVFGVLKRERGPSLTIEQMNDIAAKGWAGKRGE